MTLPDAEPPGLKHARSLWQTGRHDEACALFASLAEEHPHSPHALLDAARAFGQRYEIRRAEAYLARFEALPSVSAADRAFLAGQTCRMIHREEQALARLAAFVRKEGRRHPVAWLELAVLYERRHFLAEASEAVEAALRLVPQLMEALIIKARLLRRAGESARAEAVLRRVTAQAGTLPITQAQAWAALAALADEEGDYARAVALMERCKALLRPRAALQERHAQVVLGHLEALGREVTAEDFRRWQAALPDEPTRVAHLTGFPRSGTTLLENILDAHSGLLASEEREVFGRDIMNVLWREPGTPVPPSVAAFDAIPEGKRRALRQRYLAALEEVEDEPARGRWHLDKNPTHTLFIPAIIRLFPEVRLLLALRDPRDVVVSCWFQFLPLNPNSVCYLSWESTVRRYALDLGLWRRWRQLLPAEFWIEIRYEDVVDDLGREARRALDFLDLPWEDSVLDYRARLTKKTVRTPTYTEVIKPLHTRAIGRWKNYLPFLEPHLPALEPFIRAFGYD